MSTLERIQEEFNSKNGRMPTQEELIPLLTAAVNKAEAKATQEKAGELTFRVSPKGAVSVYGLGRWPVTLYKSQWDRLMERIPQLADFLEMNKASLASKDDGEASAKA